MKLRKEILTITAAFTMIACGSHKAAVVRPTIITDTKPAASDTIVRSIENDSDEVSDSLPDDTTTAIPIPYSEATSEWKRNIREGLDKLMDHSLLETSVCGLEVWDLDDDLSLYRHDEKQRLRPASTLKTVTAITALNTLGADYDFNTSVMYTGNEPDSVHTWHGDIYIIGGMDPHLSQPDVTSMAKAIKQLGIDSIMGNIYADQSFKDSYKYGSGWCWDDDENPLLLPLKSSNKDQVPDMLVVRLRREGIYFGGDTGTRTLHGTGRKVAEVNQSLRSVMRPMLKNSNNNCAESVFYAMIHDKYGDGASARQGQLMVRTLMRNAGIDNANSYDIVDGSGLSLYDYISPHAEVMLLRYAWKDHDIYKTLYPLLPIAGRDGTLRRRMRGTRAAGNVHAKTGTVTGVRSLCGYLTAANGHHIAFSIMNQGVNGEDGTANRAKALQDAICRLLCETE